MTKHDLKELAAMGAELGAAKAEIEKLRGLLREAAEDIEAWGAYASEYFQEKHDLAGCAAKYRAAGVGDQGDGGAELAAIAAMPMRTSLSQQPEPTDTYTAVDMATAAAQGFRDGQAAVEQAPAQDELVRLDKQRRDDVAAALGFTRGSDFAWSYLLSQISELVKLDVTPLATRPAQTEQQPVEQWQVRYLLGQKVEERWWQDSTAERASWCAEANAEQLAKGLPDVWEIRLLYTAPIAQTDLSAVTAERDRLREEMAELWKRIDKFQSQSHGITALAEIERLRAEVERLRNELAGKPLVC